MDKMGELIQYLRKQKGLSQKELADILSTSSSTISKWESGRSMPDVYLLSEISKFFQISGDDLLNPSRTLEEKQNQTCIAIEPKESDNHSGDIITSHSDKPHKTLSILTLCISFLICAVLCVIGFIKYKFEKIDITYLQSRHLVETDYGPAYEIAFFIDAPINDETRVSHSHDIYEKWLNGNYGDMSEKVLIVNYYDDLEAAEKWLFTELEVTYFDTNN